MITYAFYKQLYFFVASLLERIYSGYATCQQNFVCNNCLYLHEHVQVVDHDVPDKRVLYRLSVKPTLQKDAAFGMILTKSG